MKPSKSLAGFSGREQGNAFKAEDKTTGKEVSCTTYGHDPRSHRHLQEHRIALQLCGLVVGWIDTLYDARAHLKREIAPLPEFRHVLINPGFSPKKTEKRLFVLFALLYPGCWCNICVHTYEGLSDVRVVQFSVLSLMLKKPCRNPCGLEWSSFKI